MTDLRYMQPNAPLTLATKIQEMPDATTVILPETIFYAQGGGQPSDQGTISSESGEFRVEKVQNIEGVIYHYGEVTKGELNVGDEVVCKVDTERRTLNTRIHSAGHLLDLAVKQLGFDWVPSKGYHFPDGPYVEYAGTPEEDWEAVAQKIERAAQDLIKSDLPVTLEFMNREEMEKRLPFVPEYLPTNRPSRAVFIGEVGVPCGGTHVTSLSQIGEFYIERIRMKSGSIRVGYKVD